MKRLRIGGEEGIALVMALGVMMVLTIVAVAAIEFTTRNARHAYRSRADQQAFSLAEAGVNNALSQLGNRYSTAQSTANGGSNSITGGTNIAYSNGTLSWTGSFDSSTNTWTLTGTGKVKNPGKAGTYRTKTVTATVPVSGGPVTTTTPDIWKYVYSGATGNVCDMTLDQSVTFTAPLYVAGNLCLQNSAAILQPTPSIQVVGSIDIQGTQGTIGTSGQKIGSIQTPSCRYKNNSWYTPCQFNTNNTREYATSSSNTVSPTLTLPTIDWASTYNTASPGPKNPCTTSSGTPPTFDNDSVIDNDGNLFNASTPYGGGSVSGIQNLTPSSSYTCKTSTGELSYNATSHVLTVKGNVYIDGAAKVDAGNGIIVRYSGTANIFLSGGFLITNNTSLCSRVNAAGTDCDWADWQPGVDRNGNGIIEDGVDDPLLLIHAYGFGYYSPMNSSESVRIQSAAFQGGVYGRLNVDVLQSSNVQGPLLSPQQVAPGQSTVQKFPASLFIESGAAGTAPSSGYTLGVPTNYR